MTLFEIMILTISSVGGRNAFTHWQLTQKRSGCRATADVRAQPALWLVAADCVVTASWVFVPNFSSISRSSRSQFAFWLLLSRRPILYQQFWWNQQNVHSYYCLSEIWVHSVTRGIEIQKALQGKSVFIKLFWNDWSNLNDPFGRPPRKLDANEMLKKSVL